MALSAKSLQKEKDVENKTYEPTADEVLRIERAGMRAAMVAMQPLRAKKIGIEAGALACLRAFKSAQDAMLEGRKELLASKVGYDGIDFYPDSSSPVCGALGAILYGFDVSDCDHLAVDSFAGWRIAMLAKAVLSMEALSWAGFAMDQIGNFGFPYDYASEAIEMIQGQYRA